MSQLTLPAVAKSFYTMCKKCEGDRYHRVLAHTSSTSAKIECEVCHSKKTYSLPKAGSATRKISEKTVAARAASSARSHTGQYELYNTNKMADDATPYSIKGNFKETQKLNHPKFGVGFVVKTYSDKVDVIFSDEVRTLMHNRK